MIVKKVIILFLLSSLLQITVYGQTGTDIAISRNKWKVNIQNANDSAVHDHWLAEDKWKHFTTSIMLYTTTFYHSRYLFSVDKKRAHFLSAGITFSAGIGKEFYDGKYKRNGFFSYKDLGADILGLLCGMVIINNLPQ